MKRIRRKKRKEKITHNFNFGKLYVSNNAPFAVHMDVVGIAAALDYSYSYTTQD